MKTVIVSLSNGEHLTLKVEGTDENIRSHYPIGKIVKFPNKSDKMVIVTIDEVNIVEEK